MQNKWAPDSLILYKVAWRQSQCLVSSGGQLRVSSGSCLEGCEQILSQRNMLTTKKKSTTPPHLCKTFPLSRLLSLAFTPPWQRFVSYISIGNQHNSLPWILTNIIQFFVSFLFFSSFFFSSFLFCFCFVFCQGTENDIIFVLALEPRKDFTNPEMENKNIQGDQTERPTILVMKL